MSALVCHSRPALRNSTFIAAFGRWSDAQEAATGSVRYIAHALEATKFAEIDPEEFYNFVRMRPYVMLDGQGNRFIRWPSNDFYFWRNPNADSDLIIFS